MTKAVLTGAGVALAVATSAAAAYTTPNLRVSQAGARTTVAASVAAADDATAGLTIYAPPGTAATTNQPAGAAVGTLHMRVQSLFLGGAVLPLAGDVTVAAPGQVAPEAAAACLQGQTPAAVWYTTLEVAAGQTLALPLYLVAASGGEAALGPFKIVACFPPADVAPQSCAPTFCTKLLGLSLAFDRVFGATPAGVWIGIWTPYQPGSGQINAGATVATPAGIAPGAVTARARPAGAGAVVTGTVTQNGRARAGVRVGVWAGVTRRALERVGTARAEADGSYRFRSRRGTFFRTHAVAAAGPAASLCQALASQLPVQCVNPTIGGFTARSPVVRK